MQPVFVQACTKGDSGAASKAMTASMSAVPTTFVQGLDLDIMSSTTLHKLPLGLRGHVCFGLFQT